MRWEVYVLSLAIILCLALPGVASECMDTKCCWEPCGEKVEQAEYDAVYALSKDFMLIGYYDVNSNNRFDQDDGLYIDAVVDWESTRWETEVGDVRLTDFCGEYPPNTKIMHGESDAGMQLKPLPNCMFGQAAIGFVDVNNDGVYDLGDPLYVDTDGNGGVSVNDVRLTDDEATSADESYTRVTLLDKHEGEELLDTVTYRHHLVTPIFAMLGYIDSDCSMTWTCVDKLYLQQLNSQCYSWKDDDGVIENLQVDGLEDIEKFVLDEQMRSFFFEPCYFVSDCVATIGDFRIYVPQTAVDEEGWPECGTKVKQMDIDAVYAFSKDFMLIGYYDADSSNSFNAGDGLYIDAVVDWQAQSWVTEAGDVRLTDFDIYGPNTKIMHGESDAGKQLKMLPEGNVFGQAVIGFVDINNDGVYDLCDPLYVDTDGDGYVSVNDVRLTDDVLTTSVDEAYTRVTLDDQYEGRELRDPVTYRHRLITPIFSMLGYIDSDCSMTWTCVDKLYLQQLTNGCFGWKESDVYIDDLGIDSFENLSAAVALEDARDMFLDPCAEIADCVATIGDFRIYMPPTAIDEGWPECGTKVTQCDIDAVFVLSKDWMLIAYYDVNSNNRFDEEDGLYIDTVFDWQSERWETEAGDVRLTDFCSEYKPNTKIMHGDNDAGKQFKPLPNSYMFGQAVIGFVDLNNDGVYDIGDPVYVDTDGDGYVSVNDVRLTDDEMTSADESYTRVTRDDSSWGRLLRDPVTYRSCLVTPIFSLLGYIDADCSMTWTCPDKLYLQQLKGGCHAWIRDDAVIVDSGVDTLAELAIIASDEMSRSMYLDPCERVYDCVVTIGDLRLYIPPDEICPDDIFDPYDENENGIIEIGEMINAIGDWKVGSLDIGRLIDIIGYWKAGSYM